MSVAKFFSVGGVVLWFGFVFARPGEVPKEYVKQFLPHNPIIVEAGAHDGTDTLDLSSVWPDGTIHAFEPVPSIFDRLKAKTYFCQNVVCYPLALSPRSEIAKFYVSGGTSDGSSSLLAPDRVAEYHPTVSFQKSIDVSAFTLDDWADVYGIDHIDFMWLDMQGSELDMLKASPRSLATVKVIYTEVSLVELYEGCPLYDEVRLWMESEGFCVVSEELPWADGGNVLFVREELLR